MLRKCAPALFSLALLACKGSVPPPSVTPVPDTCSTDAECPAKFRCDREQRRCVCTGDDACPGQFCNAFTGLCVATVPGCTSDAQCGQGNYCNRALRTCKPVTAFCQPCKSDAECGAGSSCAAHPQFAGAGTFCVPQCGSGCAAGLQCLQNLCFPAGACGQSNVCVPDSLKLCSSDGDCGDAQQTCDATLKACVARARTCPAGDACDPQARLFVHACGSDADCVQIEGGIGYKCRANACFKLVLCSQDSDCTSGQICQANADGSKSCRPGCVTASDCPLGQGCNNDPAHPRCSSGCTQNQDCPLNTVCASGACVGTTASCTSQACQTTAACPIGAICVNNCCVAANLVVACGQSPCSACTAANGCPSCTGNCFPLTLAPCSTLNDCTSMFPTVAGIVCSSGQCRVPAHLQNCTGDADCSMKGFRCLPASYIACTASGNICYPYETAAQVACAVGHP
jgi:Cys-rich repeat protein